MTGDDRSAGPSRTRRRIEFLKASASAGAPVSGGAEAPSASAGPQADPRFPDWKREGEFLYRRRQYFSGRAVQTWPERFSPAAREPEDLIFYDTETTGLSGGAGTVIFLFGAAWCEGADLAVEQLFLSDFPGEPEFLLAVKDLLERHRAFVSFNGMTFDRHVLAARFRMNRIPWEPGPQVDLLHHARRLWRTMVGSCSLKSMETQVLGVTRALDVAGEDIPLVWLEFARSGRPGSLPIVFDHNVMDIVSTARLYGVIGGLLDGERSSARRSMRFDERALGTWLIRTGDQSGTAVLEDAWRRGDVQAGIALALYHRRRREWALAAAIWEEMLEGSRSMMAAMELAKHHEHRTHRYQTALALVETAASWNLPADARARQEIRRRRERLQRKLARHSASTPPKAEGQGFTQTV